MATGKMEVGKIKFCRPEKGYGFIELESGALDVHFRLQDRRNAPRGDQRIPKRGDRVAFTRKGSSGRAFTASKSWSFAEDMKPKQSIDDMIGAIRGAKAGDRLRIVFTNNTFDGDITGRLLMVLGMHGSYFNMDELPHMTLMAVAQSGQWSGFRAYTITLLSEWEPEYFLCRTIGRELLESVQVVDA